MPLSERTKTVLLSAAAGSAASLLVLYVIGKTKGVVIVPSPPPAPAPPPEAETTPRQPLTPPPEGMVRVFLRVYGEDGSWLKDAVVKVWSGDRVVAQFNLEDYAPYPEVPLDMQPGTYRFEVVPDPSIDYYYQGKTVEVTITESVNLRIVLPRKYGAFLGFFVGFVPRYRYSTAYPRLVIWR